MKNQKSPHAADKHVGARVRMRRLMLEMSQSALGESVGLTFQQIQKYEKGTNRIGASRLQQIAHVLQVPVTFFFDGLEGAAGLKSEEIDYTAEFFATPDGLTLARCFMKVSDHKLRRAIVALVEKMASVQDDQQDGE